MTQTIEKYVPTAPNSALSVNTQIPLQQMGAILAQCGFFQDCRDPAKAIVKVLYGQEIGVSPITAMMGIHIIEGKPCLSANLIGAQIKRSGRYDYRVVTSNHEICVLMFYQDGQPVGESSFSIQQAESAGLLAKRGNTWRAYPQAMLFARALSQGARIYTPDVFTAPVYTPEELGADVVISADGEFVPVSDNNSPTVQPATPEDLAVYNTVRHNAMLYGYKTPQGNDPKEPDANWTQPECRKRIAKLTEWLAKQPRLVPVASEAEPVTEQIPDDLRWTSLTEGNRDSEEFGAFLSAALDKELSLSNDADIERLEAKLSETVVLGETGIEDFTDEQWQDYAQQVRDGALAW